MGNVYETGYERDVPSYAEYLKFCHDIQGDMNIAAITMSEAELQAFRGEMIVRLDESCPYLDEFVHITGMALMPATEAEDNDDVEDYSVTIVEQDHENDTVYGMVHGVTGLFRGSYIGRVETDGVVEYRVRHVVKIGNETDVLAQGTRCREDHLFGFFELDSSVILIDEIEQSLLGRSATDWIQPDKTLEVLNRASERLVKILGSTTFLRQSIGRQRRIIDDLVRKAEVESGATDRYVKLAFYGSPPKRPRRKHGQASSHAYAPHFMNGQATLRRLPVPTEALGGMCLGVESIERPYDRHRPFRSGKDFTDRRAGLSLVIDATPEYADELGKQVIYVPISSQQLDVIFY